MCECAPAFRKDSGRADPWAPPRLWGSILKSTRKPLSMSDWAVIVIRALSPDGQYSDSAFSITANLKALIDA